jgi:D-allose transport system substrate-binding protein
MKNSKRFVALLVCLILLLGATSLVGGQGKTIRVGVLLKTLANPYWVAMKETIVKEIAKAPDVKVEILAAQSEQDVAGQLDMLENMVASEKYDAIAVAPITPNNCITGVVKANQKGIPVVNIDEKFDMDALAKAGGYVVGYATSDNIKVGQMGAKLIMDKIGTSSGVCIIEGQAGATSGELRRDGAKQAFKAAGVEILDIQPGNWDRQVSLDVATNMINKFGAKLKGIFTANDTMALGVLQAMENTGRTDICLVSTDANPEVRKAIEAGKLSAVVQSPGGIGMACVEMAVKAVKNKNPGSLNAQPETHLIPAVIVTPPPK